MKNKLFYLAISFTICFKVNSQHILKDQEDVQWYQGIHQEYVYMHFNTSLLFTGEYLFYKVYCLNSVNKQLTKTSKVAYVELLAESGELVFRHKILLDKGKGQGDYFIPTTVPSGNYKLIAYTKWMLNGKGDNFFDGDVAIVNPYRQDQSVFLNSHSKQDSRTSNFISNDNKNSNVLVSLSATELGNRSKGVVELKGINGLGNGNYSISIRKVEDINQPKMLNAINHETLIKNINSEPKKVGETILMPEFSGEMISGKILDKSNNQPVSKKHIAFSIAENESEFDITNTNENGVFYFNLKTNYKGNEAIYQVLDKDPDKFNVDIDKHESFKYDDLKFNQFTLAKSMDEMIVSRSIHNQIQNGFFSVKPDTVKTNTPPSPFFGNNQEVYDLDDYTRFPTVNETVIEIIEHAWTRKDDDGKRVLVVRGREFDPYFGSDLKPLVIVDGVFVQDHEMIIGYDARKIKSIAILRDEYYYGDKVYKGVLALKTLKGEFHKEFNDSYITKNTLFTPQPRKSYFVQKYNTLDGLNNNNRIPDYRHQLIWIPNFTLDQSSKSFEFFTSDVDGSFEVSVEGFTENGAPVSIKQKFVVK
ncbi:hypothetical protein U0L90_12260 [Flavobacteriaceae sp. LMIT009]